MMPLAKAKEGGNATEDVSIAGNHDTSPESVLIKANAWCVVALTTTKRTASKIHLNKETPVQISQVVGKENRAAQWVTLSPRLLQKRRWIQLLEFPSMCCRNRVASRLGGIPILNTTSIEVRVLPVLQTTLSYPPNHLFKNPPKRSNLPLPPTLNRKPPSPTISTFSPKRTITKTTPSTKSHHHIIN